MMRRKPSETNAVGTVRGLKKSASEQEPDLRLTPTTLRRVIKQRDKLEENMVDLRTENERLKKELEEHANCGKKIEELTTTLATTTANNSTEKFKVLESENKELKEQLESISLALKSSEALNVRFRERAMKVEVLENRIKELEIELNDMKEEKKDKATASPGLTAEDFFKAIENFKIDSLMGCISERVFVHVVAPRTILQVGNNGSKASSSNLTKEFKPKIPSDDTISEFIRKEIEPHFQMVFKTLDATSSTSTSMPPSSSPPSVEMQLAPDGSSVKSYAERFNSSLAGFIKKCIQES